MANHKLSVNSALSDDYIYTSDTILSPTSASPLGAFTTDAGPNALFARLDGMLCQLSPAAPGKNAAGWEVTEFKNTSGVSQAVAGVQSDGTVHGFYADDSNLYHIASDGTSWSGPAALAHCTGLRSVVNPTTDELVITERTAETHVCRILAKLGLGSRAQVAALFLDQQLGRGSAE